MTDWWQLNWWWWAAGAAVLLELFTGTFYLLMLALGLLAGAVAALLGLPPAVQWLAATIVGCAGWALVRQRRKSLVRPSAADDLDVGESVQVDEWLPDGTTQVKYRGASWQARTNAVQPLPGMHRVAALQGNSLVLEKI